MSRLPQTSIGLSGLSVGPNGGVHQPIISEAEWIKANVRLIREIGTSRWLTLLLENLRGNYVKAS